MATIEPAQAADIEQLADLLAILFAQEADFTPDRDKQRRALQAILAAPQVGRIFVARGEESAVLGMVSLLASISTAEGGPVAWLEDMIVRPDARGQGLGSRLIEYAINQARHWLSADHAADGPGQRSGRAIL